MQLGTWPATGQEMEWEESWNTMESFGVTVVPSDHTPNSTPSTPSGQPDTDLFQDMHPVFKKTRKVSAPGLLPC